MDIARLVRELTLEEKVGQMFMLAFAGDRLDEAQMLIQKHRIGGCYLSHENAQTARSAATLAGKLQDFARSTDHRIPLILGVDQEGTWAVLVPESTTGPGNLALGATFRPDLTESMYAVIGSEMSAVGYNAVLAPCCDVNANPRNPIIGMRSFGEYPEQVARHAGAAVRGLRQGGVLSAAKHFPGHGDTVHDSHRGIPRVDRSRSQLEKSDFAPFRSAIDSDVDMVMTSHILYPQIDNDNPATFSRTILQDILRRDLGFGGVIVSDSMNMKAIRDHYDHAESAVLAIEAGVDLIMLAEEHYDHDSSLYVGKQLDMIQGVARAVRTTRLEEALIDQAVERILLMKQRHGLLTFAGDSAARPELVGCSEHRRMEEEIAAQAVVRVRDRAKLLPIPVDARVALVNCVPVDAYGILTATRGIGPNQGEPAYEAFEAELSIHLRGIKAYRFERLSREGELPEGLLRAEVVIAVTEDYTLPGADFDTLSQRVIVRRLAEKCGDRLLIVGLRAPYELADYPRAGTYVCACSSRPCGARAAAKALVGGAPLGDHLPVSVPGTESAEG